MSVVRLASRGSRLALVQTGLVAGALRAGWPDIIVETVVVETLADRNPETPIPWLGDKAAFVTDVERAVLEGRADAAVHSLKDMPGAATAGLRIVALLPRADARDALVSRDGYTLDSLPRGALVATSSLRRQGQLLHHRPDLRVTPLRGNVDTRLRKLTDGQFDACILAMAGLERLGVVDERVVPLDPRVMVPAPGQGILAVQCADRSPWEHTLAQVADETAATCWQVEEAVTRGLGSDCHSAVGCWCHCAGDTLCAEAAACTPDGAFVARAARTGPAASPLDLAAAAVEDLLRGGAAEILERSRAASGGDSD